MRRAGVRRGGHGGDSAQQREHEEERFHAILRVAMQDATAAAAGGSP